MGRVHVSNPEQLRPSRPSMTALGVSSTIARAFSAPTISAAAFIPGRSAGDRGSPCAWVSDASMCTSPA